MPGSAASRAFRSLAAAAGTHSQACHLQQCTVGAPPMSGASQNSLTTMPKPGKVLR